MELVIEYKERATGLKFVRFEAHKENIRIDLYCSDDNSGAKDIVGISLEDLNSRFEETNRSWQEA